MAFGTSYRSTFPDRAGRTVQVDFKKKGFTGPVNSVRLAQQPLQRETSKSGSLELVPLRPTVLSINVVASEYTFLDALYVDDTPWRVEVQIDGVVDFVGPLRLKLPTESDDRFPTSPVELIANDGLGPLQNVDFVRDDGTQYAGRRSVMGWIMEILRKTGLGLDVHASSEWWTPSMTSGQNPLEQDWISPQRFVEDGEPMNCFEVLEDLVGDKLAFLTQVDGAWHVKQRQQFRDASFDEWVYSSDWTDNDTSPSVSTFTVPTADADEVVNRQKGGIRDERKAWPRVRVTYEHGDIENVAPAFGQSVRPEVWSEVDYAPNSFSFTRTADPNEVIAYASVDDGGTVATQMTLGYRMPEVLIASADYQLNVEFRSVVVKKHDKDAYTLFGYGRVIHEGQSGTTYYLQRDLDDDFDEEAPSWTTDSDSYVAWIITPEDTSSGDVKTVASSVTTPPFPEEGTTVVDIAGGIYPTQTDADQAAPYRVERPVVEVQNVGVDKGSNQLTKVAYVGDGDAYKLTHLHGTGPTSFHDGASFQSVDGLSLADDWKVGPYSGESPTGRSQAEMAAVEAIYQLADRRRAWSLKLRHTADGEGDTSETPFLPVHEVYEYREATRDVTAVLVRRDDTLSPTVETVFDDGDQGDSDPAPPTFVPSLDDVDQVEQNGEGTLSFTVDDRVPPVVQKVEARTASARNLEPSDQWSEIQPDPNLVYTKSVALGSKHNSFIAIVLRTPAWRQDIFRVFSFGTIVDPTAEYVVGFRFSPGVGGLFATIRASGDSDVNSYEFVITRASDGASETTTVNGQNATEALNTNFGLSAGQEVTIEATAYSEPDQDGIAQADPLNQIFEVPLNKSGLPDQLAQLVNVDLDQTGSTAELTFEKLDPQGAVSSVEARRAEGRNIKASDSWETTGSAAWFSESSGTYTATVPLTEGHNSYIQVALRLPGEHVMETFAFDADQVPESDYSLQWQWNDSRSTIEAVLVAKGDEDVSSYRFAIDADQNGTDDDVVTVNARSATEVVNPAVGLTPGQTVDITAVAYAGSNQTGTVEPAAKQFDETVEVPALDATISQRPEIVAATQEQSGADGEVTFEVSDPGNDVTAVEARRAQGRNLTSGDSWETTGTAAWFSESSGTYTATVPLTEGHNSYIQVALRLPTEDVIETFAFDADQVPESDYSLQWQWNDSRSTIEAVIVAKGDEDVSSYRFAIDADQNGADDDVVTVNGRSATEVVNAAVGLTPGQTVDITAVAYAGSNQSGTVEPAAKQFDETVEVPALDATISQRPEIVAATQEQSGADGEVTFEVSDPGNDVTAVEARRAQGRNLNSGDSWETTGSAAWFSESSGTYTATVPLTEKHDSYIEVRLVTADGNVARSYSFDADAAPEARYDVSFIFDPSGVGGMAAQMVARGDEDVNSYEFTIDDGGNTETTTVNGQSVTEQLNETFGLQPGQTVTITAKAYSGFDQSGTVESPDQQLSETYLVLAAVDGTTSGGTIVLNADHIKITGQTDFASGYDPTDKTPKTDGGVTIRSTTSPPQRPSGDTLQPGDIWIDTTGGDDIPYSWNGSQWIRQLTSIDGGFLQAGTVQTNRLVAGLEDWTENAAGFGQTGRPFHTMLQFVFEKSGATEGTLHVGCLRGSESDGTPYNGGANYTMSFRIVDRRSTGNATWNQTKSDSDSPKFSGVGDGISYPNSKRADVTGGFGSGSDTYELVIDDWSEAVKVQVVVTEWGMASGKTLGIAAGGRIVASAESGAGGGTDPATWSSDSPYELSVDLLGTAINGNNVITKDLFAKNLSFNGSLRQLEAGDAVFEVTSGHNRKIRMLDDADDVAHLFTKAGDHQMGGTLLYSQTANDADAGQGDSVPSTVDRYMQIRIPGVGPRLIALFKPVDTTPPNAPTSLSATDDALALAINLNWTGSTSSDVASYAIYRSQSSGGPYTIVDTIPDTSTSYTDAGVQDGTTYYYVVTAIDDAGNESSNSNEASATAVDEGGGPQ